jgi:hypothetical protein
MDSTKELGKAIFNLQRFQILQMKINQETTDIIPDHYVYAWAVMMYPAQDTGKLHEDLEKFFSLREAQVDEVIDFVEIDWLEGKYHSFYDYEAVFNARSKKSDIDRIALVHVFRYSYLRNAYNEDFWEHLLAPSKHPSEAKLITKPFSLREVFLIK